MTEGANVESPSPGGDNSIPEAPTNQEVTKTCIEITDWYWSGLIEKINAILELQKAILRDDETIFLSALAIYVKVLDRYEWLCAPGVNPTGACDRDVTADSKEEKHEEDISQMTKQRRAQSSKLDDNKSSRPKINICNLPWVTCNNTNPSYLSPSLAATQSILKNISRDFKAAKALLLNSPMLPQFPESEWVSLLSGWAIDLDHVLASYYSTLHKEKCTKCIGEIKLVVGCSRSTKTVETCGNWVSAWDQTVKAMLFIFEHRATELRDYGHHITQLFTSLEPPLHTRIIQYNCAVWNCVAQCCNLLLTNFTKFSDLHVLHIQKLGIASGSHSEGCSQNTSLGSRCWDLLICQECD